MVESDRYQARALPAAALLTYVAVEVLRVWLPAIWILPGGRDAPLWVPTGLALLVLIAPAIVLLPLWRGWSRTAWSVALLLTVLGRLALAWPLDGTLRLVIASATLAGAIGGLAVLAGGRLPSVGLLGVLLGLTANVIVHLGLRTHDVLWRSDPVALLLTGTVVLATLAGGLRLRREIRGSGPDPAGAAWPWLLTAPALLLVGVLSGVPGRTAVAVGWSVALTAGVLGSAHVLGALLAVAAPRLGRGRLGALGGVLVIVGTAGALRPEGPAAVAAQALLAVGVGAVIGAAAATVLTGAPPDTLPASLRRAAACVGAWTLLGLALILYYGAYQVALPLPNRTLLLVAALGLGLAGAQVWRAQRLRTGTIAAADGRRLSLGTAGTIAGLGVVAALAAAAGPAVPSPAPDTEQSVTVALLNLRLGFDPSGRFALREVLEVLDEADPDVVVLNEINRGWLLTGGHDLVRLLGDELGLTTVFAPAADELMGNAVLTRYPIEEASIERLPRGNATMARSQAALLLRWTDDQQLGVIATHLSLPGGPDDGTQIAQARAVAAMVARLRDRHVPVVVAGTLNATRESAEVETFAPLLRPALPEGSATYPSDDPELLIDHVLISDDLHVAEVSVPFVHVSEHLPIVVVLEHRPD